MSKPQPSNAPFYCALYPYLAKIARNNGYALAIHGSLQRDFDLVCIPWNEYPSSPDDVVDAIVDEFAFKRTGDAEKKPHGRISYTLSFMGECFLDLSFMPVAAARQGE